MTDVSAVATAAVSTTTTADDVAASAAAGMRNVDEMEMRDVDDTLHCSCCSVYAGP